MEMLQGVGIVGMKITEAIFAVVDMVVAEEAVEVEDLAATEGMVHHHHGWVVEDLVDAVATVIDQEADR